jgi:N-acetylmuramoyl-L-alanine amidase
MQVILLSPGGSASANERVSVIFPDGPLQDADIEVLQSGDLLYIDLDGFAQVLNIPVYVNHERKKLQYTVGSIKLKWTADNAFAVVGDQIFQLPGEVVYHREKYWAPLDALISIMVDIFPAKITYDRYMWTIAVTPADHDIYAIHYDPKENGTLIRLSSSRKFDISGPSLRDQRLSITLMGAMVNRQALEMTPTAGVVTDLLIDELPESVQLTFKFSKPILEHAVWQDENPHQIVISLVTSIIQPDPDLGISTGLADEIDRQLALEQEKWKIDCVVIDPGHGGKDPGAIGVSGLKEKVVVLDVALRLKKLLEKKTDLKVLLTREDDHFISISNRTKFANQSGGKLFISIHCNASKYGNATGFETYFLKPARSERAMEVALRENSVIRHEESGSQYQDLTEENYILLAMAQAEFVRESELLAETVQKKLKIQTQLRDRGVDQAGFYVLVGASMPAILIETPFLSNKREEKLLKSRKFRQKLAQGIFDSIVDFKRQSAAMYKGYSTASP